ncbi:MAG: hypothetical protein ACKOAN_01535 [Chakrabartia sp.]
MKNVSTPRHPELGSGSIIATDAGSAPLCSWMLNQVQHEAAGEA